MARLDLVHPKLKATIIRLEIAMLAKGIQIEVVQGLRTFAEQDALFALGRTKKGKIVTNARGGQSNHNYGLAVDVCPFLNGKPDWDNNTDFNAIGLMGESMGLEWGGHWKHITDKPHLQLKGFDVKQCLAWYRQGGLPLVWSKFV